MKLINTNFPPLLFILVFCITNFPALAEVESNAVTPTEINEEQSPIAKSGNFSLSTGSGRTDSV